MDPQRRGGLKGAAKHRNLRVGSSCLDALQPRASSSISSFGANPILFALAGEDLGPLLAELVENVVDLLCLLFGF